MAIFNPLRLGIRVERTYTREETAKRALDMVGKDFGEYNLVDNNFEHFATWAVTGKKYSVQADRVRSDHSDLQIFSGFVEL